MVIKSFIAAEDIAEHMPVTLNSDGKVEKMTANTDKPLGVTDRAVKAGQTVDVVLLGISYVQVKGAAAVCDRLTVGEGGKAKVFALSNYSEIEADTVMYIIGTTLEGDAADAYLKVLVNPVPVIVPAPTAEAGGD